MNNLALSCRVSAFKLAIHSVIEEYWHVLLVISKERFLMEPVLS